MSGNMIPPSNMPGGRYTARDDRARSSQLLYGLDDEPQIVAHGIVLLLPGSQTPIQLIGGHNVAGVLFVGGNVQVRLSFAQQHNRYGVYCNGELISAAQPRHILTTNKTLTTFEVTMVDEIGTVLDLSEDEDNRKFNFWVRKAI